MVGSNRNRGAGGSDTAFQEPEGTGTDVLPRLEPVQEPKPSLRTAGNRNSVFWRNSQKNYSKFVKNTRYWMNFNEFHKNVSLKNAQKALSWIILISLTEN